MSYHVTCDWCRKRINHDDDQAQLPVTIYHRRGNGTLDTKWTEETKQTRHFHVAPKQDVDRTGTNRMGLAPEEDLERAASPKPSPRSPEPNSKIPGWGWSGG